MGQSLRKQRKTTDRSLATYQEKVCKESQKGTRQETKVR
jgi:hypothetical protein